MRLAVKKFEPVKDDLGDVVLIHGTGSCAQMWDPQIKLLQERGYRCILPDLRGHGESHEPGERTNIEAHLSDVLETFEGLDIRFPAIFAGHSLGAIISLELASRRPELCKYILAVAMPGRVPGPTVLGFKAMLGLPYQFIKRTKLHHNFAWRERVLIETNQFSLEQILENFADLNYVENVPKVQCPVHYVVGRFDPVAPWRHVQTMHEATPGSTFEVIEWAGHNCMDSQPAAFNRWFLGKLKNPI